MDQSFVDKMKAVLIEQKKTLLESLAHQSEDMKVLIKTVDSGDEVDVASDVVDGQVLNALGEQDSIRLQQVENALQRINQNKYGICVLCGKEIPQDRLEILPSALMCMPCQSDTERRNRMSK